MSMTEFERKLSNKESQRKYREKNRDKIRAFQKARQYYKSNRSRYYELHIKRKYGLEAERYKKMVEICQGHCFLCCKVPTVGKGLMIDHDHTTGKVRGLLCSTCNIGLGAFHDNVDLLFNAISYLSHS